MHNQKNSHLRILSICAAAFTATALWSSFTDAETLKTPPPVIEPAPSPSPKAPPSAAAYIPVGEAKTKKVALAIPTTLLASNLGSVGTSLSKTFKETFVNDLTFMDLFTFLSPDQMPESDKPFQPWKALGAELVIQSKLSLGAGQKVNLEFSVSDVQTEKQIFTKTYLGTLADGKLLAHTAANDLIQVLTRLPGIFLTKIAMSCDGSGHKELYVMNYDGSAVHQVTYHRSIAFAPAWSPDSTRLAYSLYTRHKHNNNKNIDLYEFDFTSNSIRLLSNRKGINSGAAYSPDGKQIALTMSFAGNPEIYSLSRSNLSVSKLTQSFGFDVDPAWSKDSSEIAFVSSRAGKPMVFKMKANGSQVERITYAGDYNASPSWSPQTPKIAFAGWSEKHFEIFTMHPDGSHIERLTKNVGNNEDPTYSPDGNFIAFTSNRARQKNIYVMNGDGSFVKRLTYGLGNCVAPKWSNAPQAGVSDVQK